MKKVLRHESLCIDVKVWCVRKRDLMKKGLQRIDVDLPREVLVRIRERLRPDEEGTAEGTTWGDREIG